ncbi:MAG: DUF2064 domain-containing protein [Leadbetterella sp.]|nr:DUF2064 domain-containing protein [Leadbetterella sp.]
MYQSVAILIFARELSKEASLKVLAPKNQLANKQIFQNLNILTNQKTRSTQIPVFISNDLNLDSKASFGQNITAAISTVFDKGFENLICIGNDCPALKTEHILTAAEALNTSDAVFGPDFRGGTYLIGLTKKAYDNVDFQALPWQTPNLFQSILASFSEKKIQILDQLQDINTFQDLVLYLNERHIVSFLLKFTSSFQFLTFSWINTAKSEVLLFSRSFRGPPIFGF